MNTPIKAWHFIHNDFTIKTSSMKRPLKVHQGQVLRHRGPLELCKRGLHASIKPIDAIYYAPGSVVCRVECSGDVIHDEDKLVCSRKRVLWVKNAERTLHEFAIRCAEEALKKVDNPDPRVLEALRVKKLWLDGKVTDEELKAARYAARSAAGYAARSAAIDAAWYAAWYAAIEAAQSAQNEELERRLLKLEKAQR